MPGHPAADRNIWYVTLRRSPHCRSGPVEVRRRREAPPDQTSRRSAHKQPPSPTYTSPQPLPPRYQWPIGNLGREDGLGRQVYRYRSTPPASSTWRERFKHQDRTSIQIDTAREFDLAGTVQASGPVWTVAGYLVTSQWDSIPRSSNV